MSSGILFFPTASTTLPEGKSNPLQGPFTHRATQAPAALWLQSCYWGALRPWLNNSACTQPELLPARVSSPTSAGTSLSTRTNTDYMFTSMWHCSSELFATEKGPGGATPSLSSAGKTNARNALSFPAAVLASLSALSAPHSPNHPTNSLADFLLSLIFKSN